MVFHRIAGAGPYGYCDMKSILVPDWPGSYLIKANICVMYEFQTPAFHSRPCEK